MKQEELNKILEAHNLWLRGSGGADLSGAEIELSQIPQIRIVPETGSFECWKKLEGGVIARLRVPASAGRVNSTGRKCRAERAKVVELLGRDGKPITEGFSRHDPGFIYKVGKMSVPDSYDPDFRVECSNGIHFFITRQEAEGY